MAKVAKTTKKKEVAVEVTSTSMNLRYIVKKHLKGNINNVTFDYPVGTILELPSSEAYLFKTYLELETT